MNTGPLGRAGRQIARSLTVIVAVSVIAACGPTDPSPGSTCNVNCELASLGSTRGISIGAAVTASGLADPTYGSAVTKHFNSITAEFEMKWRAIHPGPNSWDWTAADEIVDFARTRGLAIRGHTLVWGNSSANPPWLLALTDPQAFRAVVVDAITTEVSRYAHEIDRWDVVNEAFGTSGTALDQNVFYERIGPDYVALAFATAHAADPDASLWLNETGLEYGTMRVDAFIAFVQSLVARNVPIDGVGIQTHLLSLEPVVAGHFTSLVTRLRALGLEVAITEMDVPTGPNRGPQAQSDAYGRIAREFLEAGGTEIATWGVSDNATWLDDPATRNNLPALAAFPIPSNPLLLDWDYQPKMAYRSVADALWARPETGGRGSARDRAGHRRHQHSTG